MFTGMGTSMLQDVAGDLFVNFHAAAKLKMTREFPLNEWIVLKHDGAVVSSVLEVSSEIV